jgi:FkbM family methyltransferase
MEGAKFVSSTVKRKIANLFDRPGGHWLLSAAATHWARSVTGDHDLSIIYDDGMWIDVIDQMYIPRSSKFGYYNFDFESMRRTAEDRLSGSLDYWTHVYRPQKGDTVIDVGAGIGIDTLALSPLVGSSGRIYSIEAHPRTFHALLKTCELNRLTNVTPLHYALSEKLGHVWISDLPNSEENSISDVFSNDRAVSVPAIDLDTLVVSQGIQRIAFLKMNIEGAERTVIKGINGCASQIDHIAIACHDFRGDAYRTRQPVIEFLQDHGFEVIERRHDPRIYVRDHIHGIRKKS